VILHVALNAGALAAYLAMLQVVQNDSRDVTAIQTVVCIAVTSLSVFLLSVFAGIVSLSL